MSKVPFAYLRNRREKRAPSTVKGFGKWRARILVAKPDWSASASKLPRRAETPLRNGEDSDELSNACPLISRKLSSIASFAAEFLIRRFSSKFTTLFVWLPVKSREKWRKIWILIFFSLPETSSCVRLS